MKTRIISISILAVTAVALFSCIKAETENVLPAQNTNEVGVPFEFNAGTVDTKTTNSNYSTYWVAGDQVNLFHKASSGDSYTHDGSFTAASNGSTSKFTGTLASAPTSGDTYVWYALYPYNSGFTAPAGGKYIFLSTTQNQTGANSTSHLSGSACPLGGKSVATNYDATPSVSMHNLTSIVKVQVKNKTAATIAVSKVTFTASDNKIGGKTYVNLTGDTPVLTDHAEGVNSVSLNVLSDPGFVNEATSDYYFAIRPFVAANGTTITISVKTNNGVQEVIKTLEDDFEFMAGKIHEIQFNYNTAAPAAISTESGPLNVGFESSESFNAGTSYQSAIPSLKGGSGQQWAIIGGDVTSTAANVISGSQVLSLYDYTANSFSGEAYTDFRLSAVKEVRFKAKASNANYNKLKLFYSTNNKITWTLAEEFTITTSAAEYSYTFGSEQSNVAFKFALVQPATRTNKQYISIDDVSFSKTALVPTLSVTTNSASNVKTAAGTTATLNGTISLLYGADIADLDEAGFYYKTSGSGPYSKVTCSPKPAAEGSYSYNLTGLSTDTEYTYHAYAIYDGGDEIVGTDLTFTPQAALQAVYVPTSTSAVSSSGSIPAGATAAFVNTYSNNKFQLTASNSMTLTLHGYAGKKITAITLSMRSNTSTGAGTFSAVAGTTSLASISSGTNFSAWYDNTSYGTSYRDVHVSLTNSTYTIGASEDVVITIAATVNSLFCQSFTIEYE